MSKVNPKFQHPSQPPACHITQRGENATTTTTIHAWDTSVTQAKHWYLIPGFNQKKPTISYLKYLLLLQRKTVISNDIFIILNLAKKI